MRSPAEDTPLTQERKVAVRFILMLGRALQRYGTPAHRLEQALSGVAEGMGIDARFYSTPTAIFASFGGVDDLATSLIRSEPGDIDLERLGMVDALTGQVARREVTPGQGVDRLEHIAHAAARYSPAMVIASSAAAGGAGARLFGGGWLEIAIAAFASLCGGLLGQLGEQRPALRRVRVPLAAVVASGLATYAASRVAISAPVATLGGIFVCLPGLSLTIAMTELSTQNLVSGTARLMGAAVVLLQLVFGVALGARLGVLFPPAFPPSALHAVWTELPALGVMAGAVMVLLRADPRDAGGIVLACAVAYWGARAGARVLGPELGAFGGATLLGVLSNAFARWRSRPALITVVPGLLLLVPGSVGFRGMESLLGQEVVTGMGTLFRMTLVAASLGAGILFANVLLPPRRAL